jgi:hypothetical protein
VTEPGPFSVPTLNLFSVLLAQVRLDVNASDLVEQATVVATARVELLAALAAADQAS